MYFVLKKNERSDKIVFTFFLKLNDHPTLINSCSEMALEIVQRSNAPNDAWRNLESHYRAKETREILRLSHKINGKTMEPGGYPFKFMTEIDRLAADLHRLGDKSVTELRNSMYRCMYVCMYVYLLNCT